MIHDIDARIESEWFTGDEYDRLIAKRDRLARFKEYVKLRRQFTP